MSRLVEIIRECMNARISVSENIEAIPPIIIDNEDYSARLCLVPLPNKIWHLEATLELKDPLVFAKMADELAFLVIGFRADNMVINYSLDDDMNSMIYQNGAEKAEDFESMTFGDLYDMIEKTKDYFRDADICGPNSIPSGTIRGKSANLSMATEPILGLIKITPFQACMNLTHFPDGIIHSLTMLETALGCGPTYNATKE